MPGTVQLSAAEVSAAAVAEQWFAADVLMEDAPFQKKENRLRFQSHSHRWKPQLPISKNKAMHVDCYVYLLVNLLTFQLLTYLLDFYFIFLKQLIG